MQNQETMINLNCRLVSFVVVMFVFSVFLFYVVSFLFFSVYDGGRCEVVNQLKNLNKNADRMQSLTIAN